MPPVQLPLGEVGGTRGLRDAVSDAWQEASLLFSQHAALASQEAAERTAGLSADMAGFVGGVVLLHAGTLALAAAAGFGLHAAGLAPWLASTIVAVVLAAMGACAVVWAKKRLSRRTTPRSETIVALGESVEWFGGLLRGERR
jgi:Putative Actinobacterial Holin-X, holin superfamily III